MTTYQIKPNGRKLHDLELNNEVVGKMKFSGFGFNMAEIIVRNARLFRIEPKSFWSGTRYVKEQDTLCLEFRMRWNGKIVMNTYFTSNPLQFTFKRKGMFKNSFVLLNTDESEVMSILPSFNWSKFKTFYTVEVPESLAGLEYIELLIMTGLYCVLYIQTQESAATA